MTTPLHAEFPSYTRQDGLFSSVWVGYGYVTYATEYYPEWDGCVLVKDTATVEFWSLGLDGVED